MLDQFQTGSSSLHVIVIFLLHQTFTSTSLALRSFSIATPAVCLLMWSFDVIIWRRQACEWCHFVALVSDLSDVISDASFSENFYGLRRARCEHATSAVDDIQSIVDKIQHLTRSDRRRSLFFLVSTLLSVMLEGAAARSICDVKQFLSFTFKSMSAVVSSLNYFVYKHSISKGGGRWRGGKRRSDSSCLLLPPLSITNKVLSIRYWDTVLTNYIGREMVTCLFSEAG